jgi:hypothetical protein
VQVQGIDMSTPELLTKTDAQMLGSLGLMSFVLDNSVVSGWILNATRD